MPCDSWCSEYTCEQEDCNSCGHFQECERPAGWVPGPNRCHSWCDGSVDPSECLQHECNECKADHGCPEPPSPPKLPPPPRPPSRPPHSPSPPPSACAPPGHSPGYPNCVVPEWLCCDDPLLQCFRKMGTRGSPEGYGQCRDSCPGGWDCEILQKPKPLPPPAASPPVPHDCSKSGFIDRYGFCFDNPHCCSPDDGCYRRYPPRDAAICRPLSVPCWDDDEWMCPESWIGFYAPSPPYTTPQRSNAVGGDGFFAASLAAWMSLSVADQWLVVCIFGILGCIALLTYFLCCKRNSSGKKGFLAWVRGHAEATAIVRDAGLVVSGPAAGGQSAEGDLGLLATTGALASDAMDPVAVAVVPVVSSAQQSHTNTGVARHVDYDSSDGEAPWPPAKAVAARATSGAGNSRAGPADVEMQRTLV